MTAPQRAISERMCAANTSGVLVVAIAPSVLRRSRSCGDCIIPRMSAFSFITIARGVPAGATIPYHCTASNPLTPDSEIVGVCGNASTRCRLDTPSARSFPARMWEITGGMPVIVIETWPRSEEHTSELQSHSDLVCRLLLEKKKKLQQRQAT